jgi:heptosyltransferase III
MLNANSKIILSRTDSIGDVILTLPMAGLIKKHYPQTQIFFLGRTYTKDVVALSEHIDGFINYDEIEKLNRPEQISAIKKVDATVFVHVFPVKEIAWLAKESSIPIIVGTTNRLYHWLTCNKLIRLSRKNSTLHESQLNLELLNFLKLPAKVSLSEMYTYYGFTKTPTLLPEHLELLNNTKRKIILHPKSKGSAKEWGLENFQKLISILPSEKFRIYISGTEQDAKQMHDFLQKNNEVINLTGKLSLQQFIAFINRCDALVAASTGPLHIAAALGKSAIGLFSPKRPIHPGRWMPIGKNAHYLVYDENCVKCESQKGCDCIKQINPQQIVDLLK